MPPLEVAWDVWLWGRAGRDENKAGIFGKQNGDSEISLRCFPGKTSYLERPLKGPCQTFQKSLSLAITLSPSLEASSTFPISPCLQPCSAGPTHPAPSWLPPPRRPCTCFLGLTTLSPCILVSQTVILTNARVTFPNLDFITSHPMLSQNFSR